MFFTTCSEVVFVVSDFCFICASPKSYDEPEILSSSSQPVCLMSADAGYAAALLGECQCGGPADPLGGTRDQNGLASQMVSILSLREV